MVLRHSFPDGQRKKNDPEWQKMRAAAKLKVQKAQASSHEEKSKINQEIDRVQGRVRPKKKRILDML